MNEPKETAVATREPQALAVARSLPIDEVLKRLQFVKQIMKDVLVEDVDYGTIPGCGPKPALFQPGAQKLALTFQLHPQVQKEVLRELGNGHREYEFIIRVGGEFGSDGVGTCSTMESKYRYRDSKRMCPQCNQPTLIKGKAEYGGGWICFEKKGGCGAKFVDDADAIMKQQVGQIENPNPADQWNTVRKMSYKRGLVHAIINATNTSELWTQDFDDEVENAGAAPTKKAPAKTTSQKTTARKPSTPPTVDAEEVENRANDDTNPDLMPQGGDPEGDGSERELQEGELVLIGKLDFVNKKESTKKKGEFYWGLKFIMAGDEEVWITAFDRTLGQLAEKMKGKDNVKAIFTTKQHGDKEYRNLTGISLN